MPSFEESVRRVRLDVQKYLRFRLAGGDEEFRRVFTQYEDLKSNPWPKDSSVPEKRTLEFYGDLVMKRATYLALLRQEKARAEDGAHDSKIGFYFRAINRNYIFARVALELGLQRAMRPAHADVDTPQASIDVLANMFEEFVGYLDIQKKHDAIERLCVGYLLPLIPELQKLFENPDYLIARLDGLLSRERIKKIRSGVGSAQNAIADFPWVLLGTHVGGPANVWYPYRILGTAPMVQKKSHRNGVSPKKKERVRQEQTHRWADVREVETWEPFAVKETVFEQYAVLFSQLTSKTLEARFDTATSRGGICVGDTVFLFYVVPSTGKTLSLFHAAFSSALAYAGVAITPRALHKKLVEVRSELRGAKSGVPSTPHSAGVTQQNREVSVGVVPKELEGVSVVADSEVDTWGREPLQTFQYLAYVKVFAQCTQGDSFSIRVDRTSNRLAVCVGSQAYVSQFRGLSDMQSCIHGVLYGILYQRGLVKSRGEFHEHLLEYMKLPRAKKKKELKALGGTLNEGELSEPVPFSHFPECIIATYLLREQGKEKDMTVQSDGSKKKYVCRIGASEMRFSASEAQVRGELQKIVPLLLHKEGVLASPGQFSQYLGERTEPLTSLDDVSLPDYFSEWEEAPTEMHPWIAGFEEMAGQRLGVPVRITLRSDPAVPRALVVYMNGRYVCLVNRKNGSFADQICKKVRWETLRT